MLDESTVIESGRTVVASVTTFDAAPLSGVYTGPVEHRQGFSRVGYRDGYRRVKMRRLENAVLAYSEQKTCLVMNHTFNLQILYLC